MARWPIVWSVLFIAALGWAPAGLGAEGPTWVGRTVVLRPGATVRVGERAVDPGPKLRFYRVKRADGARLFLASERRSGWAAASGVLGLAEAIAEASQGIDLVDPTRQGTGPAVAAAYLRRALIWNEAGQPAAALADVDRAIQLSPTSGSLHIGRGNVRFRSGDYPQALRDYDAGLALAPRNADGYYRRALARSALGDRAGAIADATTAFGLDPTSAEALAARAAERAHSDDRAGAIADLDALVRLDPTRAEARRMRAALLVLGGDYARAIADLDALIRLDPDDADALSDRAWIAATCPEPRYRDGRRAVEYAARACLLDRDPDPDHLEALAAAHAEAGDFPRAAHWQGRALDRRTDPAARQQAEALRAAYEARQPRREGPPPPG